MKRATSILAALAAAAIAGCTPGATAAPNGSVLSGSVVIHVSLGKYLSQSQYGPLGGYSQNPITVAKGTVIQFVNDDNFSHTASSVGTNGFPSNGPQGQSLTQSGNDVAQANWSTGDLPGGGTSQALNTATAGTYYYGCFFHYNSQTPMRGVIVVQ